MKTKKYILPLWILLWSSFFLSNNWAGVGGSAGGKGERPSKVSLQYYIESFRHDVRLPTVMFEADNGHRMHLPVTQVCLSDEQTFRTSNEVLIPLYNEKLQVFDHEESFLYTDRKEIVIKKKMRLFKPTIETEVEIIRPLDYQIEIWTNNKRDERGPELLKKINYQIENCQ